MWVRLKSIQYVDVNGKLETRYPGDWVSVGKQTANLWISQGAAETTGDQTKAQAAQLMGQSAGVVVRGDPDQAKKLLSNCATLEFLQGSPELPYEKNLLWNMAVPLRPELVPAGMLILDTWQMAIPLADYKRLAVHTGTEDEREKTKQIVHDLRIPLYHPDMIFAKRCPETEKVIDLWWKDVMDGSNPELALLRAIYIVKPFILALPVTWIGADA